MGLLEKILTRIDSKSRYYVPCATSLTIDKRTEELLIDDLRGSTIIKKGKVSTSGKIKSLDGYLVCGLRVSVIDTEDETFIVR